MAADDDFEDDVETAERRLEEEAERKEGEADARLDELLSKKKLEFCPGCGSKIRSRSEWGGRCLHDGCAEVICSGCWVDEAKRFCREHRNDYTKKDGEETSEESLRSLTLNYMNFLGSRMRKSAPDWTHIGYIRKTKAKTVRKKYGEFEIVVYEKGFLRKKPRIRILVRPLTAAYEGEVNGMLEGLKSGRIHTILVLVGGSSPAQQKAAAFAEAFSNKGASLFVMDMENGGFHFNPREKFSEKYSCWLDPAKAPVRFADLLKGFSESVSGRKVVSVRSFSEGMGIGSDEAAKILRECGLLEEAKGADSFIIKE